MQTIRGTQSAGAWLAAVAIMITAASAAAQSEAPTREQFKPEVYEDDEQPVPPAETSELFQERGALTPRGSLVFEPSLTYSHSSASRVAIEAFTIIPAVAVGLIDIREVRRDTLTATAAFRLGLSSRLEIETRVPYVVREDEVRQRQLLEPTSNDVVVDTNGNGIGDVEAALRYQFNVPRDSGPYFIGSLRGKSRTGEDSFEVERDLIRQDGEVVGERPVELPTGSGFWAVEPGITAVYPTDPAVLYGNLSYTWNIEREIGNGFGTVDPGDFIGFSFGMGFGINQSTSFSLGYSQTTVLETQQEGAENTSSFERLQVASLRFGLGHVTAGENHINLSLAVGVTEDAPDLQLSLSAPIRLF